MDTKSAKKKSADKSASKKINKASRPVTRINHHSIYLYYARIKSNGTIDRERVYFFHKKHAPITNVETKIADMADNAVHDNDDPPAYGGKIKDLVRRRKGYFVLVIDSTRYKVDQNNPMTFAGTGPANDGSHTFINARYMPVAVGSKVLDVIICENIMRKHSTGNDLGDNESETFDLTVNFIPSLPRGMFPDSGGTNMGPPLGPP